MSRRRNSVGSSSVGALGGSVASAASPTPAPAATNRAAGLSRPFLLVLLVLLLGGIGLAVWESDWMLERQAKSADRQQLAEMAARMPGSAIVQYYYGRQLARAGEMAQAAEVLQKALGDDPNSARIVALLGDQWTRQAKFAEAGALLENYARRHKPEAETQFALGVYYYRVYAHPKAAEALKTAARLDPHNVRAWQTLGETQVQLGQFDEAIRAYTEALKLLPNDVDTLLRRARANTEKKAIDAAETDLRTALKLAPARKDVQYALGELLVRNRFTPDARREAEALLRPLAAGSPPIAEADRELGRLYTAQQRLPEAEAALKAYTDARPNDAEGFYLYATVLRHEQKPDAAIMARYRAAKSDEETRRNLLLKVQSEPRNVPARLEQARFLASHGETAFAILTYERVLHYAPNNGEARAALDDLRHRFQGGDSRRP